MLSVSSNPAYAHVFSLRLMSAWINVNMSSILRFQVEVSRERNIYHTAACRKRYGALNPYATDVRPTISVHGQQYRRCEGLTAYANGHRRSS